MNFKSTHNIYVRAILAWLLFIPIVFMNAAVRELIYKPFTGELLARQVSTVTGSVAFFLLAYFLLRHYIYNTPNDKLLLIGLTWVALTIVFEFGLGIFVTGASWSEMLYDYNLRQGRIWIFFLVIILITPIIIKYFVSAKNKRLAA
jgi:membrane protease YdiL (CAAX protease family)